MSEFRSHSSGGVALRKMLADQQGVPAYIVFGDQVLWNMIDRMPSTMAQLLEVSGVGPAKLDRR